MLTRFGKFPVFFVLLALSVLAAGLFGAVHNQLSFTVGPDYFHSLKFDQMGIPDTTRNRLGAAIVGLHASWWMGLAVGSPALLYGLFRIPRAGTYLAAGIGAIGMVVFLAAFAAMLGLLAGLTLPATGWLDPLQTPDGVQRQDFLRAGLMREASYLGGALGALLAFWPIHRAARLDTARLEGKAQAT